MLRHEHIGFNVDDPVKVAEWYRAVLGLEIVRAGAAPLRAHFLRSPGAGSLIEFYHNSAAAVPDYAAQDPLVLHIAFVVDDLAAERARLIGQGAQAVDEAVTNPAGDQLVFLRDPWGLALQLVRRATPML